MYISKGHLKYLVHSQIPTDLKGKLRTRRRKTWLSIGLQRNTIFQSAKVYLPNIFHMNI